MVKREDDGRIILPSGTLSPDGQQACFELLALLETQKSDEIAIYLNGVTIKGKGSNSYTITVRRTR